MRPAADGKKLFLCREVWVLMDRCLLPEDFKNFLSGVEKPAIIFPAGLRVLGQLSLKSEYLFLI